MQDTPANKFTWSASILAPKEYVVKMSANTTETGFYNDTFTVTKFKCDIYVPSYLIAIAVGDLEYRWISGKVGVITEPGFMNKTVTEFENLGEYFDGLQEYFN